MLKDHKEVEKNIRARVKGMNGMTGDPRVDNATIKVIVSHWVTHNRVQEKVDGEMRGGYAVPSNSQLRDLVKRFGRPS